MDWAFRGSDLAIVFATLAGPVLAVQAQKWLERRRAVHDRREQIFRVLMATRAARLAGAHVEALNAIPVEFYGTRLDLLLFRQKALRKIVQAWRLHHEHLGRRDIPTSDWELRREDLFIDLLVELSDFLGYEFDKSQLLREVYYPTGHANMEREGEIIRQGLAKLFGGEISLPMDVKTFAVDPVLREADLELRRLLRDWLNQQLTSSTHSPEASSQRRA